MSTLAHLPGLEFAVATRYFSLGRHALAAGLKTIGIGNGQIVLLPGYICRDLIAAVRAVQAEPIFYPVGPALSPLPLPGAAGAKAVIAVNYFGFPQDLRPFQAFCAEHGAVLIEDNAHGFLSRDAQGAMLGSRGDLGIASLRKTFATPDGAALIVNRKDLCDRLPLQLPCRNDPLPPGLIAKRALRRIQNGTGIRVRSLAESAVRYARKRRTGQPFPMPLPESEIVIPGDPAIHCESLKMLARIEPERESERRRDLYRGFERELCGLDIEPLFKEMLGGVSPYGYPFRASEAVASAAARIARRNGFDCSRWPDLPAAVAPGAPDFYRNVYWVNFLC